MTANTGQEVRLIKSCELDEALLLESQILALQKPSGRTLKAFIQWFKHSGRHPALSGRDEKLFDDETDLVALAPVETDSLNRFFRGYLGWLFENKANRQRHHHTTGDVLFYHSARRLTLLAAFISVTLSAILLIGAITCLLLVAARGRDIKIGMITLFTCLFGGVVGMLTKARRAEIFAATAAYTVVLVVFVSNPI
ncbi:hypothetical protein BJ875DRAFT_499255 [Amylocarpus encephaloides]|uniref:DUF6594 domain-containing protein n=1 Tax=Amylocarpus encephaloides TaxID=45428 RepID=A0A9P7YC05_9HELO|nr:hypothetical protein BJ875DRAFT_499255 [Amylocarpus encephaloides]